MALRTLSASALPLIGAGKKRYELTSADASGYLAGGSFGTVQVGLSTNNTEAVTKVATKAGP